MLPIWMILRGSQVATAVAVAWGLINAWNVRAVYAAGEVPSPVDLAATAVPWITAALTGVGQLWAAWQTRQANGQNSDVFRTLVDYLADTSNPTKRAAFFIAVIALGIKVFDGTPGVKAWLHAGQALPLSDWGATIPPAAGPVPADDPVALANAYRDFLIAQRKAGGA